jgi:hypothetical protein
MILLEESYVVIVGSNIHVYVTTLCYYFHSEYHSSNNIEYHIYYFVESFCIKMCDVMVT